MLKEDYMKIALNLAESVNGQTSPNPPVGSVVVKEGRIIGMGAHLKAGERHAERIALDMAGSEAEGADVYVTLEPCSHYGKTPPCADYLIEKRVKRVFVATLDPNPLVAGKGIQKLKDAGIEVETGICGQEAKQLYKPFFHFIQTKTPFVTIKTAVTADGKIATYKNDSKWITSEQARKDVHLLRKKHDAILVGIHTVLHDNPLLTVRLPQDGKNPIRVILDTHLRIPYDANVITNKDSETIIVCGCHASEKKELELINLGVTVIRQKSQNVSISELLQDLGRRGIMTLLVEGGSEVNGSFLQEKAFQRLILYMAPKIIGGREAITSFSGKGVEKIADSLPLVFEKVEMIGPDVKMTASVKQ
jgi:diaminohydroxyphosphoribosylaminopyrimidine deaminase/5-amino-6-(5-phosphoribosylamino)uracil reductase